MAIISFEGKNILNVTTVNLFPKKIVFLGGYLGAFLFQILTKGKYSSTWAFVTCSCIKIDPKIS